MSNDLENRAKETVELLAEASILEITGRDFEDFEANLVENLELRVRVVAIELFDCPFEDYYEVALEVHLDDPITDYIRYRFNQALETIQTTASWIKVYASDRAKNLVLGEADREVKELLLPVAVDYYHRTDPLRN